MINIVGSLPHSETGTAAYICFLASLASHSTVLRKDALGSFTACLTGGIHVVGTCLSWSLLCESGQVLCRHQRTLFTIARLSRDCAFDLYFFVESIGFYRHASSAVLFLNLSLALGTFGWGSRDLRQLVLLRFLSLSHALWSTVSGGVAGTLQTGSVIIQTVLGHIAVVSRVQDSLHSEWLAHSASLTSIEWAIDIILFLNGLSCFAHLLVSHFVKILGFLP